MPQVHPRIARCNTVTRVTQIAKLVTRVTQIAKLVANQLGKELKYRMHDNPSSRPGHDLRYSLDGTKLREMGWQLPHTFEESLRKTIEWTLANPSWMDQETFLRMPAADDTPALAMRAGAAVRSVTDLPHSKL